MSAPRTGPIEEIGVKFTLKKEFKLLIFDLDGTLVDSREDLTASINRVLVREGFPVRALEEIAGYIGQGHIPALRRACPEGTPDAVVERLAQEFLTDYAQSCCVATYAYNGAREMAETLHQAGFPMAVITNKAEPIANSVVSHFFPSKPFAPVRGFRPGVALKPDPEAGLALCRDLGIAPEDTLYLGDGGGDMVFARACGFFALGAAWGYRGHPELEANGADAIIDHPIDLIAFLRQ